MENKFTDFHAAWWFLYEHPMFKDNYEISNFEQCLSTYVAKVNPKTCEMETKANRRKLNTKTEVWLTTGQYDPNCNWHDEDLDTGGDTYEEAIINLANNVYKKYGDGKGIIYERIDIEMIGREIPKIL